MSNKKILQEWKKARKREGSLEYSIPNYRLWPDQSWMRREVGHINCCILECVYFAHRLYWIRWAWQKATTYPQHQYHTTQNTTYQLRHTLRLQSAVCRTVPAQDADCGRTCAATSCAECLSFLDAACTAVLIVNNCILDTNKTKIFTKLFRWIPLIAIYYNNIDNYT